MPSAEQACKTCGEALPPKARFCPACGARQEQHQALKQEEGGEHRQITVMFSDLVGSTQLSAQLDAEDLRDVLRTYQTICAEAIESRGGMIASYLGDGVMAYFGYPRATEDAAIRAADAALEIGRRIGEKGVHLAEEVGITLATRVALHTGRVLVGEMGAGETRDHHAVTGVVPNLAARLEALAPANGVVVSSQTRALIGGAFDLEPMGAHMLRGIDTPVEVFRVLRPAMADSVLSRSGQKTVGREREVAALCAAWEAIGQGGLRQVLVSAEPGAGKSALAAGFVAEAGIPGAAIVEFTGNTLNRNTPFASLRVMIGRGLGQETGKGTDAVRRHIRGWFPRHAPEEAARHGDALTALWLEGDAADAESRARLFAAFSALMEALPAPALVVVDDAQWVDASTLEMLDRAIVRQERNALALVLMRPGRDLLWTREPDLRLSLAGLGAEACQSLIEDVAGGPVTPALAELIGETTGGLPLFAAELTKSFIETGLAQWERGTYRLTDANARAATPASVLDLITARLDALGEAKAVAQIAAVLGRNVDRAALIAVSGEDADTIDRAISALSQAGILSVARGGTLRFGHVLYQTAAYESLLRGAQSRWHQRYADWLQADPERLAATRPEALAYHLECCGRRADSAAAYLEAGLSANRVSASFEAAAHFRKCRKLLGRLPEAERDAVAELRAQVLLAGALLSARGPGAEETRGAYEDALNLAARCPESEWHFPAYWGWWRVSESFAVMAARARRLLQVSERMQGQEFKLQAKHCVWANAFQMGDLADSVSNAREGIALYDTGGFEELGTLYGGHDCKVCALGEIGLATWLQGAGDAALVEVEAAIAHAEHLDHLGSLLHALDIAVMLHHYRRDLAGVRAVGERLVALGRRYDLEDYRAKGEIFLGCGEIEGGDLQGGLARLERGFQVMREIGTPEDFPVYQSMRADALRRLGQIEPALAALAEARAVVAAEGVNYWGAELARSEAEVEMARPNPDAAAIARLLAEARTVAHHQGALALELRAAITGAAWADGEGNAKARLEEVLARFAPGADGRDLHMARALLSGAAPG